MGKVAYIQQPGTDPTMMLVEERAKMLHSLSKEELVPQVLTGPLSQRVEQLRGRGCPVTVLAGAGVLEAVDAAQMWTSSALILDCLGGAPSLDDETMRTRLGRLTGAITYSPHDYRAMQAVVGRVALLEGPVLSGAEDMGSSESWDNVALFLFGGSPGRLPESLRRLAAVAQGSPHQVVTTSPCAFADKVISPQQIPALVRANRVRVVALDESLPSRLLASMGCEVLCSGAGTPWGKRVDFYTGESPTDDELGRFLSTRLLLEGIPAEERAGRVAASKDWARRVLEMSQISLRAGSRIPC